MRGMVRLSSNFFWDTLDMYRNHWNGFQAGTSQHPTWPIDTRGLLSNMHPYQCTFFWVFIEPSCCNYLTKDDWIQSCNLDLVNVILMKSYLINSSESKVSALSVSTILISKQLSKTYWQLRQHNSSGARVSRPIRSRGGPMDQWERRNVPAPNAMFAHIGTGIQPAQFHW